MVAVRGEVRRPQGVLPGLGGFQEGFLEEAALELNLEGSLSQETAGGEGVLQKGQSNVKEA